MEKRYQQMTFDINTYKNAHTSYDEARALMWKDIGQFVSILTRQNYIAVIYDDSKDIIVVQYEHDEKQEAFGIANPVWITEDERFQLEKDESL